MNYSIFAAPPARQASDLAGKPGAAAKPIQTSVPTLTRALPTAPRLPSAGHDDLPLTRAVRAQAAVIAVGTVMLAIIVAGFFIAQLLVR